LFPIGSSSHLGVFTVAATRKSIAQRVRSWFTARQQGPVRQQDRRFRPWLEVLEEWTLLSAGSALGDVFSIDMENHNLTQPAGLSGAPQQLLDNPAAPYLNSLITPGNLNAQQTSFASNYLNVAPGIHPSEPNYVWQEAGLAGPLNDADPFPNNIVNAPNLSALLQGAGISWESYQEDIDLIPGSGSVNQPGANSLTSTVAGQDQRTVPLTSFSGTSAAYTNPYNGSNQYNFAAKHDGQLFFTATNGGDNPTPSNPEAQHYAPLQQLPTDLTDNTVARYNLITPDQYNDMHSSLSGGFTYHGTHYTGDQAAIAEGDNFLSIIVPQIMASQAYKNNGAIVIWFDETQGGDTSAETLAEIVISPLARGNAFDSTLTYTHSSDLKSLEELFGVSAPGGGFLGAANTPGTNDLSDLFKPGALTPSTLQGNALRETQTAGVFDPTSATWYLHNVNASGAPSPAPFPYGGIGWQGLIGDWNGDRVDTIGGFDPGTATWYLRNENSPGAPDAGVFQYGGAGWKAVVGDWSGSGHSGIGGFDPSTATWYLRNENSAGAPDAGTFQYGGAGWDPLVSDWTGTGHLGVGAFDPATATWYLRSSLSSGAPDAAVFQYGSAGWIPVVGDWGNGQTDIGAFDPATATWYLKFGIGPGAPTAGVFQYGGVGWQPVVGAFLGPGLDQLAGGGGLGGADALSNAELQAELQAGVAAVLGRLQAAGVDPTLVQRLAAAQYQVGALPAGVLGQTYPAVNTVLLSPDAAGLGWFIDPTPLSDEEFSGRLAPPGSAAAGHEDLLTVLAHEMGHLAGLPEGTGLMAETLPAGVRNLSNLNQVFSGGA
jgi:hypothetical protein